MKKLKINSKCYLKLKVVLFVFLLLVIHSCDKTYNWTWDRTAQPVVVIDAIITDEMKFQTVNVYFSTSALNETPLAISNAEVIVSNADSVYLFSEDPNVKGRYISDKSFSAIAGTTYTLQVSYNGKIYTASDVMTPAQDFEPLKLASDDGRYYYVSWVADAYKAKSSAMYEVLVRWSENESEGFSTARMLYYTLPSLDVSEVLSPEPGRVLFSYDASITERYYSVSDQYAAFLRALLAETTWQGGLFNSEVANLPTNLSNDALGFFAVCSVKEKKIK
jgi:hypothetical protein